ncbi:MAG TPA: hypothetical protein PK957_03865 [Candidatus Dojkabacteria bacterium]|nr:hypothetical protein [Candidatus Dojkabacteria bacterium]HQF36750.1 hypothetical protein [Candidatus Dojkabacteria bacterium]
MGKGVAIQLNGNRISTDILMITKLIKKLKESKLKFQFELPDIDKGQTVLSDYAFMLPNRLQINIPVDYQHKSVSCVDLKDIKSCVDVMQVILGDLVNNLI